MIRYQGPSTRKADVRLDMKDDNYVDEPVIQELNRAGLTANDVVDKVVGERRSSMRR